MINQIEIYNVEFGDCFICQGDSNKMLVDFGSYYQSNIKPSVIQNVNMSLNSADKKYLMISHFHNDHINGIQNLNKRITFDEVYLPNFFYKSVIRLQFASLICLGKRSRAGAFALRLLTLIPQISAHLSNSSVIRFVKRGELIKNNLDICRVLWPHTDFFEEKANELCYELFDKLKSNEELTTNEEVQRLIEKIETTSDKYFDMLNQFTENGVLKYNLNLPDLLEYVEGCKNEIFENSNKIDNDLRRKISNLQNKICLCFDNNNENKRVLFLSDITIENYQELCELSKYDGITLCENYNTIKVAHHGTKAHFVNSLPISKNLIISNGKATGHKSWYIASIYGFEYRDRIFYCTNNATCDHSLTSGFCLAQTNGGKCGINIVHTLTL